MPIDTSRTGAAIAAYRQRMNMSQQGLAGLMNVTHQAVSKWEKGLALPDTETLLALAKLFGTTMEDLLMGKISKASEATEETLRVEEPTSVQETAEEEQTASIPAAELEDLDFESIMNMVPFVSTKVVEHLFQTYTSSSTPDARKLSAIAPFISTRTLNEYIITHPFKNLNPEIVSSLAPFLPTKTVDSMILSLEEPVPPRFMKILMPFASTRVIDQMVMGKLGIKTESITDQPSDLSRQIQDKVHAKIGQKLDRLEDKSASSRHESPRMRLIRKALENGQYEMIENCFDELDDESRRMLLSELMETGDSRLLRLFCEAADELDPNAQATLVHILLTGKLYNELAEVIEELDEDVQHELLDKAFEINDPELLHILSEHL